MMVSIPELTPFATGPLPTAATILPTSIEWDSRNAQSGSWIYPPIDFYFPSDLFSYEKAPTQALLEDWALDYNSKFYENKNRIQNILKTAVSETADIIFIVPNELRVVFGDSPNYLYVLDYYQAGSVLLRAYYHYPDEKLHIFGVTGTNGKTSTVNMLQYLMGQAKASVASLGTLGLSILDKPAENIGYTTPPLGYLFRIISELLQANIEILFMELSSHGSVLGRFTGLAIDGIAWTNLTQDHLDFHKTMHGYGQAKIACLDLLTTTTKKHPRFFYESGLMDELTALSLGSDFKSAEQKLRAAEVQTIELKTNTEAKKTVSEWGQKQRTWELNWQPMDFNGQAMIKLAGQGELEFKLTPFINFVAKNLALVLGWVASFRPDDWPHLAKWWSAWPGVPGRMQAIPVHLPEGEALCFVDYAHTPEALATVLASVHTLLAKTHDSRQLIALFGCGGDRDRSKRPLMAKAAGEFADMVFVTSDNPRSENPAAIIEDIVAGFTKDTNLIIESDRRLAIQKAVTKLKPGDILVVAGKGHENYQILANETIPFDDTVEIQKAIKIRQTEKGIVD